MFTRSLLVAGGAVAAALLLVGLPPVAAPRVLPLSPADQALLAQKEQARTSASAFPVAAKSPAVAPLPGGPAYTTYDARTGAPKDPLNVLFVGAGGPWDVSYDLQHWTSDRWVPAGGGSQVAVTGAGAAPDRFQLKPAGDGAYPAPRTHVRLFALPGTTGATAADAHHDNQGHTCTDSWQGPATRVVQSFEDPSGHPLWFVSGLYRASGIGAPSAQVQCAAYDGTVAIVDLAPSRPAPLSSASGLQVTGVRVDRLLAAAPGLVDVSGDVVNRGTSAARDVRVGLLVDATGGGANAVFVDGRPLVVAALAPGARRHFHGRIRLISGGWARVGIVAVGAGTVPALAVTPVRALLPVDVAVAAAAYAALVVVVVFVLRARPTGAVLRPAPLPAPLS